MAPKADRRKRAGRVSEDRIVILGAGHGGSGVAASLRQAGHKGEIILLGDEDALPYHRPPLSKAWLSGETDLDGILLRPDKFYRDQDIDIRMGVRATEIDRTAKTVKLASGEELSYNYLVLALGARARELPVPGANLLHVLSLRTLKDAEELKTVLGPGKTLGIIGGGYIGLEAAASAKKLGCNAVIFERESRLLPRVAQPELSAYYLQYHQARGVEFVFNAQIDSLVGDGGVVNGVKLADGKVVPCDAVLVGVGAHPNIELAQAAGLKCENGVVVDMQARTSDPSIFAIGDMTWRPMPHYEDRMWRLESVPNALEQGKQVAAAIMGKPAPNPEAPWFWSDQFDLKLQIAGLPFEADRTLIRGDMSADKFAVVHLKGDQIRAVEAVNAPAEFMAGRMALQKGQRVDLSKVEDASIPLKQCLVG